MSNVTAQNPAPESVVVAAGPERKRATRDELERRIMFLTEKWLESYEPRHLVLMAMDCFGVGRRAAQRYVQITERRLSRAGIRQHPLFWLRLSPQQRNPLLRLLLSRMKREEELSVKELIELVGMTNKIIESRDHTAAELLRLAPSQGNPGAPGTVESHTDDIEEAEEIQEIAWETAMDQPAIGFQENDAPPAPGQSAVDSVRQIPSPAPVVSAPADAPPSDDALDVLPDDFELSPEITARLYVKIQDGLSPEEAVNQVIKEVEARNPKLNQETLAEYERRKAH